MIKLLILAVSVLGLSTAVWADPGVWEQYSIAGNSDRTYPAGGDKTAIAQAKVILGDWAAYRVTDGGTVKNVFRMAVVGQDGPAWIYEFDAYDGRKTVAVQEAVEGLEDLLRTADVSQAKVDWIKVLGADGKTKTLSGDVLALAGGIYKNFLVTNSAKLGADLASGGPVTVPAGSFAATWHVASQVNTGKVQEEGEAWVSTVVPLWHLVKTVNKSGSKVVELVDFGTSGFQSAFH